LISLQQKAASHKTEQLFTYEGEAFFGISG